MPRKGQDVLGALAQGRQADVQHVDPIVEVFAECLLGHHAHEIAIRRRDQPKIDLPRGYGPDAGHFLFLQNPQKLYLRVERHVPDLVEEERAAVGQLEQSHLAVLVRAGKGPGRVAEKLGLSSFGMAAQLTLTKGPSGCAPEVCRAWATSSLPVPVRPCTSTG